MLFARKRPPCGPPFVRVDGVRRGTASRAPTCRLSDRGGILVGFSCHNLDAGYVHGQTVIIKPDVLLRDGNFHETRLL